MKQRSFFHTLYKIFLFAIITLAGLSSAALIYVSYQDYRNECEVLRDKALADNTSLLRRKVQIIKSLADAKAGNIDHQLKEEIFYRTQEAIDIAYEIYTRNSPGKQPDEIKALIHDTLSSIRYSRGTGYYFVTDFKKEMIVLYPPDPTVEGRQVDELGETWVSVNKQLTSIINEFGDGFLRYKWAKADDQSTLYDKSSFVKRFDPYDWFIGTGLYIDNFRQVVEDRIIKDIETLSSHDQSYALMDGQGEVLIGDLPGAVAGLSVFTPGEFKHAGDRLYYCETIKELGWVVGASSDLSYINQRIAMELQQVKQAVSLQLMVIVSLTILFITLFVLLLNKLNRRIQDNFDLFSVTFEQAAKTNQTIPGNNIAFDELKELCETANIMINENREIKDSLKQRVDKRTSELKEAQAQLLVQERLAVLGQLTATVSHELRNPLGAISNGLHSIETALEIDNLPMAEKAIRLSERSIARCTRIIDELLDYGREEKLNLGPVAIEDLVNETLDDLAISGDIKLTRQLMGKTTVAADHDKLRQVIVNLVINAQQALQDSSQTDKRITVATRKREDTVEIVIEDNGPGVPENLREKIFEPLFSTKNFGIGLGMTIVEKIVMSHKGEITLQPNRTQGCCFVISLPIKDQYII